MKNRRLACFLVQAQPIFTERSEVNLIIEIHEYFLALGIAVGLALGIFTIPKKKVYLIY